MGIGSAVVGALAIGLIGIASFLALANRATRRVHADFGASEVETALRCILDDSQCHDEFDLFLAWPIHDPYLESIRQQCRDITRSSAAGKPGEDMSESGKDRIREVLRKLRERI